MQNILAGVIVGLDGYSQENEARLLKLLEKELELLEQMLKLTERQTSLLAEDEVDAFDRSLDSRQQVIEQINGLHQESDALMQSYVSFSTSAGGVKNETIEAANEQIRSALTECAALNEKNIVEVKAKAEDYMRRIGKLSLSRKSLGAYAHTVPNGSELFDKKT